MSVRLRHVAAINPRTPGWERLGDDDEVTFLPLEAVWSKDTDYSRRRPKGDVTNGYTRFQRGDVLVPKITPTFEADRTVLVVDMPTRIGAGTTELHVVRPGSGVEARYVSYLMSSRPFLLGGKAAMTGVAGQQRVPDSWLRDIPVPVISKDQQLAIADYLDAETARIDALIAKKRRMIELLEERLVAFVTGAVTRGIDGADAVLDTSVSFIDGIPKRWKVMPLRRVATYKNSSIDKKSVPGQQPVKVCNYTDVYYGSYIESAREFMESTATPIEVQRFALRAGVVLITKDSETADDIGVPAFVPSALDAVCGYHLTVISPIPSRMRGDFLYWALESRPLRAAFEVAARGVTRFGLNAEAIGGVTLPVPPLEEQVEIARRLRADSLATNRVVGKLNAQLGGLEEHRQALITAAVTGELAIPGQAS